MGIRLGNNLVGIPEERKPSLHALFYRVEACGEFSLLPKGDVYRASLKMPNKKFPIIAIHKDFYWCLFSLYKKLEKEG